MNYLMLILAAASLASLLALHITCRQENEKTAMRRSAWAAIIVPTIFIVLIVLPLPAVVLSVFVSFIGAVGLILIIPTGKSQGFPKHQPQGRIDERTIMFSRAALKPESENFEKYYELHPEHRQFDDRFRRLPGLMSPKSGKFEPLSFAAAAASFETVEQLASLIDGPVESEPRNIPPEQATRFIKGWLKKLGAVSSGVTLLKDEHLYTVKGRGEKWGQPINLKHRFAIAFSVEMDHRQLGTAPNGPTLMESAEQYLNAGAMAVQVAVFIRKMGWAAEAHIDANYKVICPLVGRDAGLGEIGRMGLLMTPELGPRVRLGVITTDLSLIPDKPGYDPSVLHFCSLCRKCADICPPGAISHQPREMHEGSLRWKIDSEACFTYWCATGTDCGQCMKVCPYSHPDTMIHSWVRWGIRNSFIFRHFALRMDDWLYGRKPEPMAPASWIPSRR